MPATAVAERSTRSSRTSAVVVLLLLAAAGIVVQLALSWISRGTEDVDAWQMFGRYIAEHGLLDMYRANQRFNHPPIPGYWAMLAVRISDATGVAFPFVFRLPAIAANVAACVVLCFVGRRRGGPVEGAKLAAAMACSPCVILIAGHHGNTDPIYAMFSLLAAFFADAGAFFVAGLMLGAAINVKLIPVVLIPPLLFICRTRRDVARFVAGLAVMALPFVPVLLVRGSEFIHNAMAYASVMDFWGVSLWLLEAARVPMFSATCATLLILYASIAGRIILLLAVVLFSLIARERRRTAIQATAGAAALFLILTPGFGLQYLVFAVPLLFAADEFGIAMRYSLFSGAFLFVAYAFFWDGRIPIHTVGVAGADDRGVGALFAVLAWVALVSFVARMIIRPRAPRPQAA
jgi:hypothetical protein